MRRYLVLVVVAVAGCTTTWETMWERHRSQLAQAEEHGDYIKAVSEQQWMIDNAFYHAPRELHTPASEARRYLHLARLAAKTGDYRLAVDSLKQALITDPSQAAAVRRQLDALPLGPQERAKLDDEFSWNITALQPGDDTLAPAADNSACWSYRVHEVRVRHQRTVRTDDGMQHQVTYDARVWVFDSDRQRWRADGEWMDEAGTETEWVNGPSQPRYRAITAQGGRFYTSGKVPPCHRGAWQGPYDRERDAIFVAAQLPPASVPSH